MGIVSGWTLEDASMDLSAIIIVIVLFFVIVILLILLAPVALAMTPL